MDIKCVTYEVFMNGQHNVYFLLSLMGVCVCVCACPCYFPSPVCMCTLLYVLWARINSVLYVNGMLVTAGVCACVMGTVCVCMIAPFPCVYWVTNSWQASCPTTREGGWVGGRGRLVPSLALTPYRSLSILFSCCQNSQLCIDSALLNLSRLPNHTARAIQSDRWQVKIGQNASEQAFFI